MYNIGLIQSQSITVIFGLTNFNFNADDKFRGRDDNQP